MARDEASSNVKRVLAVAGAVIIAVLASKSASGALPDTASRATSCSPGLGSPRVGSNPLGLPVAPGADPLNGAKLFVRGPDGGQAAGAIALLLGINPASLGGETWAAFESSVNSRKLSTSVRHKVRLLEKIANEPETAKFTVYNRGGAPAQINIAVSNYVCAVPPGQVAILATYYLKHQGDCATALESPGDRSLFEQRVEATARALGDHPFVLFSEFDALATSGCLSRVGLAERVALMRYELATFAKLHHGVVYVDAGDWDANSVGFTAKLLNEVGINKVRGFFLGATHDAWTIDEIRFGEKVSRLTHGAHFVVSTQSNGRGPLLNPDPVTQGIEDLCDPPGRGLGPRPTADTGFPLVDAFEWVTNPGRSSGCRPGDPPSGVFGVNIALGLAARANGKLGPGYPSRPY